MKNDAHICLYMQPLGGETKDLQYVTQEDFGA